MNAARGGVDGPCPVGTGLGVGMEDPGRGRAPAPGPGVGQPVAEGDAVIAGVEDEQWDVAVSGNRSTRRFTCSMVALGASMDG